MRTVNIKLAKPIDITASESVDGLIETARVEEWLRIFRDENLPRLTMLRDFYDGRSTLEDQKVTGDHVSSSLVTTPLAAYLVDTHADHFLGQDIALNLSGDGGSEDFLEKLKDLYTRNNEGTKNLKMGVMAGIYGQSFELSYIDKDKDGQVFPRTAELHPENTFIVYDTSVAHLPLYAINFTEAVTTGRIEDRKPGTLVLYTKMATFRYEMNGMYKLTFIEVTPHLLPNRLPVRELRNDIVVRGDFEQVLSLIEAYNQAQTTTLTDVEYLADALFVITGGAGSTQADMDAIMETKGLQLPNGMDAKFITKDNVGEMADKFKDRLVNDIHKVTGIPDMTDEKFASNASGVAMGYKLLGLNSKTNRKKRLFTEFLRDRMAYVAQWLGIRESTLYDVNYVEINFTLNIPHNDVEAAGLINQLSPFLSTEKLLSLLSFVEDAQAEMEAKEDELENERKLLGTEENIIGADKGSALLGSKGDGAGDKSAQSSNSGNNGKQRGARGAATRARR